MKFDLIINNVEVLTAVSSQKVRDYLARKEMIRSSVSKAMISAAVQRDNCVSGENGNSIVIHKVAERVIHPTTFIQGE